MQDRFVYVEYKNFAGQTVTGALFEPVIMLPLQHPETMKIGFLSISYCATDTCAVFCGLIFEPGAWDDHPTYAHTGYTGKEYPTPAILNEKKRGEGVGWDLSHARRFVHVFDSLHKHREILNVDFPSEDFMKMLTNQFLYATFNMDFKRPLFSNFMDGSNGWFRVGYENRDGFGYGPWDMSISVLTGGYGFWSVYNPDAEAVFEALLEMIDSNDPEVRKHLQDHYEKSHWHKYDRPRNIDFSQKEDAGRQSVLIQFLPSLYYYIIQKLF